MPERDINMQRVERTVGKYGFSTFEAEFLAASTSRDWEYCSQLLAGLTPAESETLQAIFAQAALTVKSFRGLSTLAEERLRPINNVELP